MNRVLVASLVSVALLSSAPLRADDPPPKGTAELQGVWKLVSVESGGESADPLGGNSPRWVVKGDKVLYGGEEIAKLTADPTTNPRVIDLKFGKPDRVYEGIYAVEKDTLKICLNRRADAKDRPSKLATKDQEDWRMLVFEREKAAPPKPTDGLTGFVGLSLRADEDNKAVVVNAPIEGSPADKAGLKKDDIILKVGGTAATDLKTAINAVRETKPGAKLDIRISRDGKESTVTVPVGVLPFNFVAGLE